MADEWTDRLSEYVDGDLSADDRARLDVHLASCATCRHDLEELRGVLIFLKSDPGDEPRPETFRAISQQLRAQRPRWPLQRIARWAAAAAIVVVIGIVALQTQRDDGRADPHAVQERTGIALPVGNQAAPSYHAAVADLEQILRQERGRLDPETRQALEASIQLIDLAIRQSEAALVADTGNPFVARHLEQLRRAKLGALRDAAAVARTKS